jgi:hypothetical protein|tara:strand:+ start:480 stop:743 length:264 start_codon:yes stop_codon:yes gene_type:complete
MKFTIAEKEFEIQPAKTKSILQIEERLGKSLSKIGDDVSFSDIITIVTIALTQSDANIDVDWVTENTSIADMGKFNEVMTYFLAIPK